MPLVQSEMEKMKKTQHVQAVYIRKMQSLPGKVREEIAKTVESCLRAL